MPIDPIEFGRLTAQVEALEKQVERMSNDVSALLELANRSKGGFWMGMTIASGVGAVASWVVGHWKP